MTSNGFIEYISKNKEDILLVNNLRVWFPIRRGIGEILARKPRRYVKAVDGIFFNVKKRETFCLVGESGCGKTTTGKALLRLVPITGGNAYFRPKNDVIETLKNNGVEVHDDIVDIANIPLKKMKPIRREISMIYQDPFGSLNPRYTVGAILEEPFKIHKLDLTSSEIEERVYKALEQVRLVPPEDFIGRHPHQLSGGQRQRVAIARAIILNPGFVIADEPVSMLDVSIRAEILELMLNLKEQQDLTYLFITHDLAVARYICDRIAVMYLGSIVEMGDARRIIEEPMHPYTKALVAAIPEPDPTNRLKIRSLPIKGEVPSAANIPVGCRFHPRCVAYDENKKELGTICEEKEPVYFVPEENRYVSCWLYRKHKKIESIKDLYD